MTKFLNLMISITLVVPAASWAGQMSLAETVGKGAAGMADEMKKDEIKREIAVLFKQTDRVNAKVKLLKAEADNRVKNGLSMAQVDPTGRTLKEIGEGGGVVGMASMAFGLLLRSKGLMTLALVILGVGAASYLGGMAQDEQGTYALKVSTMSYVEIGQELKNLDHQLSELSSKIEGAQRELYAL